MAGLLTVGIATASGRLWTRAVQAGGRLVIAIDGKTARGVKARTGRPRTWSWPPRRPSSPARPLRDDR
jgi:hypothetical protein